MKPISERSVPGRRCDILPQCGVLVMTLDSHECQGALYLPEASEQDVSRHHTELAKTTHGVNGGLYPLGSCTVKYNPKISKEMASPPKFTHTHPLQPKSSVQSCLEAPKTTETLLYEITDMDEVSFQPVAGTHREFTNPLLVKTCHESRGDKRRKRIIVPGSARGTSPASVMMTGFEAVNIPSQEDDCVDLEKLRAVVGKDAAGLMLTNPNTVGLLDKSILNTTRIIHKAGGFNYYNRANLDAVMGVARPGDIGFGVIHLNLHKTFSTPHGGSGPGSGPVGREEFLTGSLPGRQVVKAGGGGYHLEQKASSAGMAKSLYGNFLAVMKALTYITTLGEQGILEASHNAVPNANHIRVKLSPYYHMSYQKTCTHELVMGLEQEKHEISISATDIAKALLDYDIHPSIMYFPLTAHEALMVESTETESKEDLDELIHTFVEVYEMAKKDPEKVRTVPHFTMVERSDEVAATRDPRFRYELKAGCNC